MTIDLTTRYLGLELKNPLVVAACPIGNNLDLARQCEAAGASAMTLPSLFEEQLVHDQEQLAKLYDFGADSFGEALSYFPQLEEYRTGSDDYLRMVEETKKALSIPVIASLNGISTGGWTGYAKSMQDAGADALELNIYFLPTDPEKSAAQVEQKYLDLVAAVRSTVSIPLTVKMGPFFSSPAHFARALVKAGANGMVLFNRFLQPDIDLDELAVKPRLELSTPAELRLPLRWIAILRDLVDVSLAASSGAHSSDDIAKLILAGADVTTVASVLLQKGPKHLEMLRSGLESWMAEKEYTSVQQMKGSLSQKNCPSPEAFERANYVKTLISYTGEYV